MNKQAGMLTPYETGRPSRDFRWRKRLKFRKASLDESFLTCASKLSDAKAALFVTSLQEKRCRLWMQCSAGKLGWRTNAMQSRSLGGSVAGLRIVKHLQALTQVLRPFYPACYLGFTAMPTHLRVGSWSFDPCDSVIPFFCTLFRPWHLRPAKKSLEPAANCRSPPRPSPAAHLQLVHALNTDADSVLEEIPFNMGPCWLRRQRKCPLGPLES